MVQHADIDHTGLPGIPDIPSGTILVPDLLNSPEPGTSPPDAEFTGTISPFTAVDGGSGTVSLIAAAGAGLYDVATRSGWVLMQTGTASGDSVLLKQDYTLPDGKCIVAAIAYAQDNPSASNEIQTGIVVNDNDTGPYSGTAGQTSACLIDAEASSQIRIIHYDGTTATGDTGTATTTMGLWFLRIDRSGLVYRAFCSKDGFAWTFLGSKTMGTAANNVWLVADCLATQANRVVVGCAWFRQGTALAIDPFPLA